MGLSIETDQLLREGISDEYTYRYSSKVGVSNVTIDAILERETSVESAFAAEIPADEFLLRSPKTEFSTDPAAEDEVQIDSTWRRVRHVETSSESPDFWDIYCVK